MTKKLVFSFFIIFIGYGSNFIAQAQNNSAQESKKIQYYLGIQPTVNAEAFDEYRNTIEINLVPLIFEYAVNNHWSIKLSPFVNLQFRPEFSAALSQIGAGLTVPYHFSIKNSEEGHRGFYAGPHIAVSQRKLDRYTATTLAAEIGYSFIFNRVFSVTVGAQAGKTIAIAPETGYRVLSNHSEAIFAFGFWF